MFGEAPQRHKPITVHGPLSNAPQTNHPLERARRKAYWRLLPLLFVCYVVAYIDRSNVAIAKLTMAKDLPRFDNYVIGFGRACSFGAISYWKSQARCWSRNGARAS